MLDQLISIGEELRPSLQEFLGSRLGRESVRGALLEVDRHWFEAALVDAISRVYPYELYGYIPPPVMFESWYSSPMLQPKVRINLQFRPRDWSEHCRNVGYPDDSQPFIIRIILRRRDQVTVDLPLNFQGFPLRYEYRPPVTAASTHQHSLPLAFTGSFISHRADYAASVGRAAPDTAGTLGGFLRHPNTGEVFLISCAHVLGPVGTQTYLPGPFEGRNSIPVGSVQHSEVPLSKAEGSDCNLDATPGAGRLDVSIANLLPAAVNAGVITPQVTVDMIRPIGKMNPYQQVFFIGKVSGRVSAQISAVTLWHEITFDDGARCFGSLFELSSAGAEKGELARDGDSGAWVMDDVGLVRYWDGIVIAKQGVRAYACYADAIKKFYERPALGLVLYT